MLVATGATPRVLPGAEPDGERILTWRQLYDLPELPQELIVVGSGVTGAEFAGAYQALGSEVTLVSSRDRVLPGEDADAAEVLEDVFRRRGMTVLSRSRAAAVKRTGDGVLVTLTDGRTVRGSHCLIAVGLVPDTRDSAWQRPASPWTAAGFIQVDRVSRTTARGVYAAGRLHRGADAGLGRRDAGPDRHVARARRGGAAAAAEHVAATSSPTPRSRRSA